MPRKSTSGKRKFADETDLQKQYERKSVGPKLPLGVSGAEQDWKNDTQGRKSLILDHN